MPTANFRTEGAQNHRPNTHEGDAGRAGAGGVIPEMSYASALILAV
jgi:hypothetical protein